MDSARDRAVESAPPSGGAVPWLRRAVVAALLLDGAAPFWAGSYLPLLDLPQHLALARILGSPGDPVAGFARWFSVELLPAPYWGFLAPVWLLTRMLPLEFAARLVLSCWAICLPLSIGRFLHAIGRDWRWAAFSLPLIWNRHLFFGFTTFVVSMPIFFLTLALAAEAFARGPLPRRRALTLATLACAVFLCHAQTYLLLVASFVLLALIAGGGARAVALRLSPLLPSLALLALFGWQQLAGAEPIAPLHAAHRPRYGQVGSGDAWQFESAGETLTRMPERIWGGYTDGSDDRLGMLWFVLLATGVAFARGPRSGEDETSVRGAAAVRGELLCLLALALYLFLPFELAGQPYFNMRYLVFAALLAPCFLAVPASGRRRWLVLAGAALGFVAHLNAAWHIAAFQRETRGFDRVLAQAEPGRRLLGLVFDRGERDRFRLGPHLHFPAYYVARQGGDAGFTFAGLPAIPVRYRAGAQAPHPDEWKPWEFDWESMAESYDYFLLRGAAAGGALEIERRAELVASGGAWRLYRRSEPRRDPSGSR